MSVGRGLDRGWGIWPRAQTGSNVVEQHSVGNPAMERTTLNLKLLTRENSEPVSPSVNQCSHKRRESGTQVQWQMGQGSRSWVEHLGRRGPKRKWCHPAKLCGKSTHGEDNSQSKLVYWSYPPYYWTYLPHSVGVKPDAIWSCSPCHRRCLS